MSKSSIFKSGKKHYCDLMFTNENEDFIRWMENLENYCQKKIYDHRTKWFETELDEHDIENSFTSPLKIFKSGKFYISRTNVPTMLGKCSLKIYNEDEHEVDIETIKENTNVITILEIQGIKCSSKNFQIEIEIKQMMMFKQNNLFEKCIFTAPNSSRVEQNMDEIKPTNEVKRIETNCDAEESFLDSTTRISAGNPVLNGRDNTNIELVISEIDEGNISLEKQNTSIHGTDEDIVHDTETFAPDPNNEGRSSELLSDPVITEQINNTVDEIIISSENSEIYGDSKDILEVNMNVDDLPNDDTIFIKKRNDIYYQMYKEAKRKAKMARDLAISSYLEAKHIKNTYMLENEDSDSDFDEESFENIE